MDLRIDRLLASLSLVVISLLAPAVQAACQRNEPGYLWNYEGEIADKYPVRMTLVF